MRVMVVWLFFLSFSGTGHEEFSILELLAFFLILIGVLMFNKVFSSEEPPVKLKDKNSDDEEGESTEKFDDLNEEMPIKSSFE